MRDEIPNALDGERVDRVAALMTGLSRSAITKLISQGDVSRNGQKVESGSDRVTLGDQIEVDVPLEKELPSELVADTEVQFEVVHEDESLVVINKPIGLVVHPGAGRSGGACPDPLQPHQRVPWVVVLLLLPRRVSSSLSTDRPSSCGPVNSS